MWSHFIFVLGALQWATTLVSGRSLSQRKLHAPPDFDVGTNRLYAYAKIPKIEESAVASKEITFDSLEDYMGVELSDTVEQIVHGIRLFEPLPKPDHYTLAPARNTSELLAGEYREMHDGRWVDVANPDYPDTEQLLWVPNDGMFASSHLDGREIMKPATTPYVLKDPDHSEQLKPGEYKERSRGRFVQIGLEPGEVGPQVLWVPHKSTNEHRRMGFSGNTNTKSYHPSVTPIISPSNPRLIKRSLFPSRSGLNPWNKQFDRMMDVQCQGDASDCGTKAAKSAENIPVIAWAKPGALARHLLQNHEKLIEKQRAVKKAQTVTLDEKRDSPHSLFEIPGIRAETYIEVKNPAAGGNYYSNPGNRKPITES